MKLLRLAGALFASVLFSHCGTNTSSTQLLESETATPILVVMGGNNTCDSAYTPRSMRSYQPFRQLLAKLNSQHGSPVPFIVSCYDSGASSIYYITSESNEAVKEGAEIDLTNDLKDIIAKAPNPQLLIAGHSYGGWLALQTALTVKDSVKLAGLFSLDPISRVECTFASPMNCTSAPTDISAEQYAELAASALQWLNFYQTRTFYLHSSAIASAKQNIKIATSHVAMEGDETVWRSINQTIDNEPKTAH